MKLLQASALIATAVSATALPAAEPNPATNAAAASLPPLLSEGSYNTSDWQGDPGSDAPAPVPGPWRAINWLNIHKPSYTGDSSPIEVHPYSVFFSPDAPARMSANYTGSRVTSFTLSSLVLGCAQIQEFPKPISTYTAPVNCTVAISGYRGTVTGAPAASTTIAYSPVDDYDEYGYATAKPASYSFGAEFAGMRNIVFAPKLGDNSGGGVPQYPLYAYWYDVSYRVLNVTL